MKNHMILLQYSLSSNGLAKAGACYHMEFGCFKQPGRWQANNQTGNQLLQTIRRWQANNHKGNQLLQTAGRCQANNQKGNQLMQTIWQMAG